MIVFKLADIVISLIAGQGMDVSTRVGKDRLQHGLETPGEGGACEEELARGSAWTGGS